MAGPLEGLKVLDFTTLLPGPYATMILSDLGADVLKVTSGSRPDLAAIVPPFIGKTDLTAASAYLGRGKRSITLNLKDARGLQVVHRLLERYDVLIEQFRPGIMAKLGLGFDDLAPRYPSLIYCSLTGYGQTGPYRDLPGFGAIGEAMGGLRHLTGEPGRVPVRVGVSIGDTLAALHGTIGVLTALYHRKVNGGKGQVIDVALHEAVFNVMESLIPEYSAFGVVREAAGSALPGIAPSNAYPCTDGWVLVAGNGDSIFKRLMDAIGRPDLGAAPDLANNTGRVARVEEIDAAIGAWSAQRTVQQVLDALGAARVPAGKVYTAKDIAEDPHYRARDMLLTQETRDGYSVEVPGIVPKLSATPGTIRSSAPHLGDDTDAVLAEMGLNAEQIALLRSKGVVQ